MKIIIGLMLSFVGIIHLLPVSGVLGAENLTALYGVTLSDPNLIVLMRHRAIMFGLLAAILFYCAFVERLQWIGVAVGLISVTSFIYLSRTHQPINSSIERVVVADLVALACLLVALLLLILRLRKRRTRNPFR